MYLGRTVIVLFLVGLLGGCDKFLASSTTGVGGSADTTPPVITLKGSATMTVAQGSIFADPGSVVTDNVDVGLKAMIIGNVNTAKVGRYTLTYNVIDSAGNKALPVVRIVNVTDQTAPVIALKGGATMTVAQGSVFTDPGSVVTDNVDVGLVATVSGVVNTVKPGTYTLTYHVKDKAGNAAKAVVRTVQVLVFPKLSIADASVSEGSSGGVSNLVFTVSLSVAVPRVTKVTYTTTDGTALSASDYTASRAVLTIPAGKVSGTITILVGADKLFEPNETLSVILSSPVLATIAVGSATGIILNDDAVGLNDTGITTWGNGVVSNLTVPQKLRPLQDADAGRDSKATFNSNVDGKAGFSFTKLDAAGKPLANQAVTYAVTPWSCVLDQVTGLTWEVKTVKPNSLRNKMNVYKWYNSTGVNDGGNPGWGAVTPACTTGGACDTEKYVAAVNAVGLCGFKDWRLPEVEELYSLVDMGAPAPAIDTGYFPNTMGGYWTATPHGSNPAFAWNVLFGSYDKAVFNKGNNAYVRLVRGGK